MLALITGGGGYVGRAIAERLIKEGWTVRSFARGRYPELESQGVDVRQGDLRDALAVESAATECGIVFHTAAKVGLWGSYEEYYQANVTGTKNVLAACRRRGVGKLVFTSSPSVVFSGEDVEGWDESAPYPDRFDSYYSRTKALAEEMVLSANGEDLATVALRPHLVWGPGENHIVSRIVGRGRKGQLKRIGSKNKRVDTTYIDDCTEAHWLAARSLEKGAAAGRAYFISSGDPRPIWDIVNSMLAAAGISPVNKTVPEPLAYAAAAVYESVYRIFNIKSEPAMTRFLVSQLATAHWFDISAARRELGFKPKVTLEEGLRRLSEYFAQSGAGPRTAGS